MSACCLKCNSNGVFMAIMATTECCLLRNVTECYGGLLLLLPYCPANTPPLFALYFRDKEGGGRITEECTFAPRLSPPPQAVLYRLACVG